MAPHATGEPLPDSGVDLIQHDGSKTGDWRDDFHRDGFCIVKNVITPERAEYYKQKQIEWLQSFGLGFDPNDESTWTMDHLPVSFKGGMYFAYSSTHEKFVWEARTEPKVQETFSKLWGTDEFAMLCVQGLLNYQPNGPKDGGLIIMKGSSKFFDQFFSETREQDDHVDKPPEESDFKDLFIFKDSDVKWFEDHGCEMIKTNLEPGDLALWDSRTMHYARFPEGERVRHVQYICMTPAKFAKKEDLELKASLFKEWQGTTHWPHCNIRRQGPPLRNGVVDALDRSEPREKPEVTDRILQLAAVKAY
ncbi:hypothetical protein B0A55_01120 [Friedmanniomyces simplex]|uniref:Phytanoyl-CoA dioxygenase n=1 Tax=Friedmanniomyces simplex TaxID=329884 RepID=A0A4U0XVF8_9PEZI|nr:hypothetical protein B0A55_01120 [Friedmanniomyces simplex]